MDHHHLHHRRPSADRFITTTFSPPTTTTGFSISDDFSEDDILFSSAAFSPTTPPTNSPSTRLRRTLSKPPSFRSQKSGILAALPEPPTLSRPPSRTISISSATSDELNSVATSLPSRYHQSVPMHVPMMPTYMANRRQRRRQGSAFGFEDIDDDDDDDVDNDDDGDMLPPHEIVARRIAETPVLSTSVLEGAGRTLKGRDLRQVQARKLTMRMKRRPFLVLSSGLQHSSCRRAAVPAHKLTAIMKTQAFLGISSSLQQSR